MNFILNWISFDTSYIQKQFFFYKNIQERFSLGNKIKNNNKNEEYQNPEKRFHLIAMNSNYTKATQSLGWVKDWKRQRFRQYTSATYDGNFWQQNRN